MKNLQEITHWTNDSIQFPRLLAEIDSMGLDVHQIESLCEKMDITYSELQKLFRRAETRWEEIKRNLPQKTK